MYMCSTFSARNMTGTNNHMQIHEGWAFSSIFPGVFILAPEEPGANITVSPRGPLPDT